MSSPVSTTITAKILLYHHLPHLLRASQVALVVKNPPANAGDIGDSGSVPGSGRSPGERKWQPLPGFLPGESHGQRSLEGYSPRGRKESNTTEQLHFKNIYILHFSISYLTSKGQHNRVSTHTQSHTHTHSHTHSHTLTHIQGSSDSVYLFWL